MSLRKRKTNKESDQPSESPTPQEPQGFISLVLSRVDFWVRFTLVLIWFLLAFVYGAIFVLFRWKDRRNNTHIAGVLAPMLLWLSRLRVRVVPRPDSLVAATPCVFVLNHQSVMDFNVWASVLMDGCVGVGKESIKYFPFMGLTYIGAGNALINRSSHESAIRTMNGLVDRVKEEKLSVVIFPEGTRNPTPNTLLPFKKGAFHLAIDTGLPIVPVVFNDYSNAYSFARRCFDGGEIVLKVCDPISTKGMTKADVGDLLAQTYATMEETMLDLNARIAAGEDVCD